MSKRGVIAELRRRGAKVELLPESTRFTSKYLVRLRGRPDMRVTDQYIGGWKVSVARRAFATYSAAMTVALVAGEPLTLDLMTSSQRAAYDQVAAAGDTGLASTTHAHRQLYSLGFFERVNRDHWRSRAVEVANPIDFGGVGCRR
jgi:hypothetical protein